MPSFQIYLPMLDVPDCQLGVYFFLSQEFHSFFDFNFDRCNSLALLENLYADYARLVVPGVTLTLERDVQKIEDLKRD